MPGNRKSLSQIGSLFRFCPDGSDYFGLARLMYIGCNRDNNDDDDNDNNDDDDDDDD